jgi:predicted DNA-binding protein (MmcQ/YjbR family)
MIGGEHAGVSMSHDPNAEPTAHERALSDLALAYPEAYVDFPWGEMAIKVNKKVFLFLGIGRPQLSGSVKLPHSAVDALLLPHVKPTGYGLGKHGWVSFSLPQDGEVDWDQLRAWVDESYRAVAPKRLVKGLPAG